MLQQLSRAQRRVLMTTDAVGGVWQYALELTRELTRHGERVTLAGLGPQPSPEQKREAEAVATLVWLSTPPDWMAKDASELDGFSSEIAALMRDQEIDLVQVNAPSLAACLNVDCPIVAVAHSCISTWFQAVRGAAPDNHWAWHWRRNRLGFDNSDKVIAPSASHAAMLSSCYGEIPQLCVVHNGISGKERTHEPSAMVFAAARWWDEGKNASVLDAAAEKARWPVFAAGPTSGPNGEVIVFRNVNSLGPLSNREVRSFMARAGIFVSPSLYEPFGLAALEAASCGTPLLLADIPTYRELWDGAASFFAPRDPAALRDALDRLISDRRGRTALGSAALRRSRRFTVARQAQAMRAIYDALLSVHAEIP